MVGPNFSVTHASIAATSPRASGSSPRTRRTSIRCRIHVLSATVRVCLMIEGQEGVTWDQWRALADTAEAAGFEALFRSDHYMPLDGRPGPRLARRVGDAQRARRPHRHLGSARSSPPPPSVTRRRSPARS